MNAYTYTLVITDVHSTIVVTSFVLYIVYPIITCALLANIPFQNEVYSLHSYVFLKKLVCTFKTSPFYICMHT